MTRIVSRYLGNFTSEHRENIRYLGNSDIWTSRKFQISEKFRYHGIYMASRKYQISEKFRYHGIEKIPISEKKIQLFDIDKIPDIWENSDTLTSGKYQTSDIWEISTSWHRENIRYLRNQLPWHREISDIWEIGYHGINKYQISEKLDILASRKYQIPWHRENIKYLGNSTSKHRENIRYLGNFDTLTSRKYQIAGTASWYRENSKYQRKFIHLDVVEISDIWDDILTSRKFQISEKFSYLDIDEIPDIWEI